MSYHINDARMSLSDLVFRLERSDLIPSHLPLLDGLRAKVKALLQAGIGTVADLRHELRKPAALAVLAKRSGVSESYLVLLRRAVEGWFPRPPALADFPGVGPSAVEALVREGIHSARDLFEAASTRRARRALGKRAGVSVRVMDELVALADLSRIQWVAAGFTRLLYDAGYPNAAAIAKADAERMYAAIIAHTPKDRSNRGVIGKRDIARLVLLAGALPAELEP